MSTTAKLFMHGRSQAVRLPKEFRFEGTEVQLSKIGDKVILEPLAEPPARTEAEIADVWAEIDALRNGEYLFPEGIDDPPAKPVEGGGS
jgi:antitoxin VapB